jgi:hypothetical protein
VNNQHKKNTRPSGHLGLMNHLANPDIFLVVFTRLFHPSPWSFVRPVSQKSLLCIAFITSRKHVFFATFYFHSGRGEEESSAGHTPVRSSTSSPPPLVSRIAACPSFRLSSSYNLPPNGAYYALRFVRYGALTLIWISLVNSRSGARTLRSRTRCARARTRRRARPGASALRTRAHSTRPHSASSSLLCVEEVCFPLSLVGRVQLSLTSSTVLFELARLVFL